MTALLDVNVLLALAWPRHVHHSLAEAWFATHRRQGWATCAVTQVGFLRISSQPAVVGAATSLADAQAVLSANTAAPDHQFWALDSPPTAIHEEITAHLAGPAQLTDALLLDLAIRRGGVFATLDSGLPRLLAPSSPLRRNVLWIGASFLGE